MFSERLSSKSDAKLVIFIQSSKFSRLKFEINIKIDFKRHEIQS